MASTNPRLAALKADKSTIARTKDRFREYVKLLREVTLIRQAGANASH